MSNGRGLSNNVKVALFRDEVRKAVADYMWTEGCSCCQDIEGHTVVKARLAELLKVPEYDDGSGYNFALFRSKERPR